MGSERWGRVWVCGVVWGEGERGHAEAHAGRLLAFGLKDCQLTMRPHLSAHAGLPWLQEAEGSLGRCRVPQHNEVELPILG